MRIGIVTRHLGLPVGFGTYAGNLLSTLAEIDVDTEYVVYTPSWNEVPEPVASRFQVRRFPVPQVRSALNAWDLTAAPAAAVRDRVDLVHYLHPAYPAVNPRRPVVVNLLDAIGWVVPGYRLPQPYERLERRAAQRADLVLTLSQSARDDIARVLGVGRERIRVTYLGAPAVDAEGSDPPQPYFLFVGGTEKRKNLRVVLDAFSDLDGYELRVVGPHSPSPIHDERTEQPGVRWLGHVTREQLTELYRGATALVFPSLYEGFGLPVVEAMARRTPVITSNTSSLPEVARDAAVVVDPADAAAIRDAMQRLASDTDLRQALVNRGVEVAQSFTWEQTARTTLDAYAELCG